MTDPLILTARMGGDAGARLTALRERHFPDRGYTLPAHLTLFHKLPDENADAIAQTIRDRIADWSPLTLRATEVLDFGGGCAFRIECGALVTVRQTLADHWDAVLTKQDRQGWRPHVTVQNKVDRETAQATIDELREDFEPFDIPCPGLALWRYRGGPWDHVTDVAFGGIE